MRIPFPEYREIVARVVKALAVTAMRYHRRGRRGSAPSRAFEPTARRTWQSIFPTMRSYRSVAGSMTRSRQAAKSRRWVEFQRLLMRTHTVFINAFGMNNAFKIRAADFRALCFAARGIR